MSGSYVKAAPQKKNVVLRLADKGKYGSNNKRVVHPKLRVLGYKDSFETWIFIIFILESFLGFVSIFLCAIVMKCLWVSWKILKLKFNGITFWTIFLYKKFEMFESVYIRCLCSWSKDFGMKFLLDLYYIFLYLGNFKYNIIIC